MDQLLPRELQLLDSAFIRKIGHFYLRRLRFDGARALPSRADVPSPTSYFAPLLFAVIGAPLSAIQTNYIWEPVLASFGSDAGWKYVSVVLFMTLICGYTLVQDARRRLPETSLRVFVTRVGPPLLGLYALNFAANAFVYGLAAPGEGDAPLDLLETAKGMTRLVASRAAEPAPGPFETVLLWSSLSLYLGLFIGLIAQGQKIDEDDDTA